MTDLQRLIEWHEQKWHDYTLADDFHPDPAMFKETISILRVLRDVHGCKVEKFTTEVEGGGEVLMVIVSQGPADKLRALADVLGGEK